MPRAIFLMQGGSRFVVAELVRGNNVALNFLSKDILCLFLCGLSCMRATPFWNPGVTHWSFPLEAFCFASKPHWLIDCFCHQQGLTWWPKVILRRRQPMVWFDKVCHDKQTILLCERWPMVLSDKILLWQPKVSFYNQRFLLCKRKPMVLSNHQDLCLTCRVGFVADDKKEGWLWDGRETKLTIC